MAIVFLSFHLNNILKFNMRSAYPRKCRTPSVCFVSLLSCERDFFGRPGGCPAGIHFLAVRTSFVILRQLKKRNRRFKNGYLFSFKWAPSAREKLLLPLPTLPENVMSIVFFVYQARLSEFYDFSCDHFGRPISGIFFRNFKRIFFVSERISSSRASTFLKRIRKIKAI